MEVKNIVRPATEKLYSRLRELNIENLNISNHNKNYLKKYFNNYHFYMLMYEQLILKAIKILKKPVSDSTFIDYGGGCGILSYMAKEIGFRYVVYNDFNKESVIDAKTISSSLDIEIDHYIYGDSMKFIKEIKTLEIEPDIICSFDVLEHIYDLKSWITNITELSNEFSVLFMSGANSKNPFIRSRLKKLHIQSELQGSENNVRSDDCFLNTSFLEERHKIIKLKFPELNNDDINLLSSKTRGLIQDDIEKVVREYIRSGKVTYINEHPTNTCDPYTGSWTEKLIDLKDLKNFLTDKNLIFTFCNCHYVYSNNRLLNIPKYVLNLLIRLSGPECLIFSPSFTLEIRKL